MVAAGAIANRISDIPVQKIQSNPIQIQLQIQLQTPVNTKRKSWCYPALPQFVFASRLVRSWSAPGERQLLR
jgi:hypothetical protein